MPLGRDPGRRCWEIRPGWFNDCQGLSSRTLWGWAQGSGLGGWQVDAGWASALSATLWLRKFLWGGQAKDGLKRGGAGNLGQNWVRKAPGPPTSAGLRTRGPSREGRYGGLGIFPMTPGIRAGRLSRHQATFTACQPCPGPQRPQQPQGRHWHPLSWQRLGLLCLPDAIQASGSLQPPLEDLALLQRTYPAPGRAHCVGLPREGPDPRGRVYPSIWPPSNRHAHGSAAPTCCPLASEARLPGLAQRSSGARPR